MAKAKLTQAEAVARLEEAAMTLTASAIKALQAVTAATPQTPVLCTALVLDRACQTHIVGIADPGMRIEVLRHYAKALGGIIGFALVFDGYTSAICHNCDGAGCEKCAGDPVVNQPRIDAVVSIVRTMWGGGSTKSLAYGYRDGHFNLVPERHANADQSAVVDGYDVVFRDVVVN